MKDLLKYYWQKRLLPNYNWTPLTLLRASNFTLSRKKLKLTLILWKTKIDTILKIRASLDLMLIKSLPNFMKKREFWTVWIKIMDWLSIQVLATRTWVICLISTLEKILLTKVLTFLALRIRIILARKVIIIVLCWVAKMERELKI